MNRWIKAVTDLDLEAVKGFVKEPKWMNWSERSGKNALHYLCGIRIEDDAAKSAAALAVLKLLLKSGMEIDAPHRIEEKSCNFFPATPLWYAYTRGRNENLYKYLLEKGAEPNGCWWAIAWYDDIAAAKVFIKHGADISVRPGLDDLFLGSFQWKKYDFAKWILGKGADVNARGPNGLTALMLAVKRKDEEAIKWLIRAGADPDRKSDAGLTARSIAKEKGPRRILDLLPD